MTDILLWFIAGTSILILMQICVYICRIKRIEEEIKRFTNEN